MKRMRHFLSVVVCVCGLCVSGATDNWWRGTVDGNWSTPGNWSREHVPTADEDVYVGTPAEPIVIFVSGEESVNKIVLQEISAATATGPSVTFRKADGAAVAKIVAATSPTHGKGRAVVWDGVRYEQTADAYVLSAFASITVDNDGGFTMKAASPFFRFYDNSSFVLNSGTAVFYPFGSYATETCTFRVNGGTYDFSGLNGSWVNGFPANAVIDFRGGTVLKTTNEILKDPRYLPKGTAVVDNRGASGSGGMAFADSFDEEFSGTLYLTNNNNSSVAISLTGSTATLWGRGTYFAHWLYPNGQNGTYEFDLAKVILRQYLYSNNTVDLRFRNGVTFGAWGGDVSTYNGPKTTDLYGDVAFETADAIDGTTARTIKFSNGAVRLMPQASLAVSGAGKASLNASTITAADPLDAVDVGAGATLELGTVNAGKSPVKVRDLTLADAAKIAYTVNNTSIESENVPTVGAGASLEISASGMTAGTPKAIYYSAAADESDVLPAVNFSGSAGNWRVKRLGGLLYLEDNASYPELTDSTGWKAAPADGYWETAGNWVGGAAPGANESAVFWASSVAAITNRDDVTCVSIIGGFSPAASNAQKPTTPYVFRGKTMTLTSNTSYFLTGAFCWWGQAPVIFENEVIGSGKDCFYVYVNKPTFVEFRNKLTATGSLCVNGDVRVAGAATAKSITFGSSAGGRPTVLHVYNGGSLSVSAQSAVQTDVNAILAIASGSTVTIGGTQLAFNSAAVRSHVVNGTLSVTCPYVNLGTQTFVGAGTLAFDSATTAADGAGVTYLAHGMTLKMGGDWQTAADETATSRIALDKFEKATLGATANWTYGPAEGVTPTSASEARALTLGDHAELTVAAGARTITLAEPIVGAKASVKLASGTLRLAIPDQTLDTLTFAGGTLSVAEDACGGGWTTLLTVKKVVGTPSFGDKIKGRVIDNGDGMFAVQAKPLKGLMLILR